jgi:hypothetical protein
MTELRIRVDAAGWRRFDKPVEVPLELGEHEVPMAVSEVDAAGRSLDTVVPHQFDRADELARGRLTLLMTGETAPDAARFYRVRLGADAVRLTPVLTRVSELDAWQGQPGFRVDTPAATYIYHRYGAGFASLIDAAGNDWISYAPTGGSAGHYRGIPNLGACGHPGYTNAETRVAAAGPLVVTLRSETRDGEWAFTWDIFPTYARMTLTRAGGPYWFLYEGTPAGRFDPPGQYCARSNGARAPLTEIWSEPIPAPKWVCFGDARVGRSLFLVRHDDGDEPDQYWPMEGNMTVFGFGRIYRTTEKFLRRVPARFTIGLADGADPGDAQRVLESAHRELRVGIV